MGASLEFRVGEYVYRSRPMTARTQFIIVRKVSPLIVAGVSEVLPVFVEMQFSVAQGKALTTADVIKMVGGISGAAHMFKPVADQLAILPEDDGWFIISACLELCDRRRDGDQHFMGIWNHQAGRALSDDIHYDLTTTLDIAVHVFDGNLRSFFLEGPWKYLVKGEPSTSTPSP